VIRQLFAAVLMLLFFVCVGSSIASAASCVVINAGGSKITYPFTPGVNSSFGPGASQVTRAAFNGQAGDTLSYQANGGAGTSTIALISQANGATLSSTVFNTTATHTVTAADIAGAPWNYKITNSGTGLKDYVIGCSPGTAPAAPTVAAISPTSGTTAGGTAVTITGTNFTGATAVTIGGVAATGITVVNATTITATTGAHAAGIVDVVVTTPAGTGTGVGLYTYTPPAPSMTANAGTTPQSAVVSTAFANPLAVTVRDAANKPVAGVNVTFTAPGAGASGVFSNGTATITVATDVAGVASAPFTANAIAGGPYTVTAASAGLTTVNFSLTNVGAAASMTANAGTTPQSASVLTAFANPLAVTVKDAANNPVPGVNVTFTAPGAGAGGTFSNAAATIVVATNASGVASAPFTANATAGGPYTVTAAAAGLPTVNFSLTNISNAATHFAVSAPAAATAGSAFSVTVTALDAANNVAVGYGGTVHFTSSDVAAVLPANATLTNGVKTFSITLRTPGAQTITATDTVTPAITGTVTINVTPGNTATTTALVSSLNPSSAGQGVTFTATVSGAPTSGTPTGNVSFLDSGGEIGTGSLSRGVATFTTSALRIGNHSITAAYGGDAVFAASTSAVLIQAVGTAADSLKLRSLQVLATPLVAQASGQAISSAIDGAISEGFSEGGTFAAPSGTGVRFNFAADPDAQATATPPRATDPFTRGTDPFSSANGSFAAGGGRFGAPSTAPSRIDDTFSALGYADATKAPPLRVTEPKDWQGWAEVRGTMLDRWGSLSSVPGASVLYGNQVNLTAGLTRKVTPSFLVGVLGGYETFDYRSDALAGRLKGEGWTVGSYLGWMIAQGVRFDASVSHSGIGYDGVAGTAAGSFTGNRWLGTSGLTGTYSSHGIRIEPSAQVYAVWERENAYTDTLGALQSAREFSTGRASGGVKLSYPVAWSSTAKLAPYVGLYGDYYFNSDSAGVPLAGAIPSRVLDGWSARAVGGLTAKFDNGTQIAVGAERGGIGGNFGLWTYQARVSIPFTYGLLPGGGGTSGTQAGGTQAADIVVSGVPWWFHGYLETGERFFLNNPQRDGVAAFGGKSLAKYYEYSTVKPGEFLDGRFVAGSNDGVYGIDALSRNVGYDDQNYQLYLSKAGTSYLTLGWDQTPHVYSTSAQTIYNGVGSNALTLPAGLSNQLATAAGGAIVPTPAQAANVQAIISANEHGSDIGIRRDTVSVENRWTPTDAWDLRINYTNMRRTGTQVDGVSMNGFGPLGAVSQVTAPVADTTQNYGVSGEYAGTSPWGQKFTAKVGYGGSTYKDDSQSYTVEDPFCTTAALACAPAGSSSPLARMSLAPDNQANTFTGTLGVELPFKSRYMGTVSYEAMRQNQAFLPFTINPNAGVLINGQNPASVSALPATSLNGAINTLLVNNVLTTQITPDLKAKATYRYYNFNNDTPEISFSDWIVNDSRQASALPELAPVSSLSMAYTKQNAGEELNWRPQRQWNFGAAYGYERYDWTRADATATNENSGKAFVDWKPTGWITGRASWQHGERRFENYDYLDLVATTQWPTPGASTRYQSAMRQFYLDNRDRNKGQFSLAVDLIRGLTVTPTLGILNDDYRIDSTQLGFTRNHSVNTGIEFAYAINPNATFLFSYMNDRYDQQLRASTVSDGTALTGDNTYNARIKDYVDTYLAALSYAVIPGKLDLKLGYTLALASNSQPVVFGSGAIPATGQYPPVATRWQRFDATAKYKFDPDNVRRFGLSGDVYAKLYYAFERNDVTNWQNDLMQTYMYSVSSSTGYMTWLAFDNPNYAVHKVAASLVFNW
jgi:MtrB/PioB family decaheme-associated outer membrane protein